MSPNQILPFDDLAKLNEHGSMTKLVAAPLAIVAGVLTLIMILRIVQRVRERRMTDRFR